MSFLKRAEKANKKRKSGRLSLTPLQKQLISGILLFVLLALVLTGVWFFSRIQSLQIERIEIVGGETIPHARIEALANNALRGEYFRLIPKRFIPLYPKGSIESALLGIDRIKNLHVELDNDQTLLIVFEEYIPHALWCASTEADTCFFIDQTGYAFAQAPELEGSAFVRYVNDGVEPKQDTEGFPSDFIQKTETFIELLERELDLYVTHVVKVGDYDVDFAISGGGLIKVSQSIPMEESFENLKTILVSEAFSHIEPGSFRYIDLRFGEKIFVNEEVAVPQEAYTATSSAGEIEI